MCALANSTKFTATNPRPIAITEKVDRYIIKRLRPYSTVVGALRESIGVYCADLSTSVKFDTEVDQSILISFFEGAKAGAHWGRHIS